MNPLDDEEDFGEKLPEPESIKSFWVCCSGLAVLTVLASFGVRSITKFEHELSTLLSSFWKIQNYQVLWMAFSGVHAVFRASLIPSIVLGALVPILYWSTSLNLGVFIQLGQAAVFGIACILASMACIRLVLHRSGKVIRKIFALGLLMNLLFCANSCVYFAVFDPWGTGNWRNLGFLVSSNEVSFAICITSFFASLAYIGFMLVVGCWLKWCGWQTQEQVGMSIG